MTAPKNKLRAIAYGSLLVVAVSLGLLVWWYFPTGTNARAAKLSHDYDFEAAAKLLASDFEARPTSAKTCLALAVALRRAGRLPEAEWHLRRAHELGAASDTTEFQLCLLAAQRGNIDVAKPRINELTQLGLTDDDAEQLYEAVARGYVVAYRLPEAWDCLEHWTDWQPTNVSARMLRGRISERNDDFPAAAREYSIVTEALPQYVEARVRLASCLMSQAKMTEALAAYEVALSISPDNPEALVGAAECYHRLGKSKEAIQYAREALQSESAPDITGRAHAIAGMALLAHGDNSEAKTELLEATKWIPRDSGVHFSLSRVCTLLGEAEMAKKHQQLSSKMASQGADLRKLLGSLVRNPHSVEIRCQLGTTLMEFGRYDEAASWFQHALLIDPQCEVAKAQLVQLQTRAPLRVPNIPN